MIEALERRLHLHAAHAVLTDGVLDVQGDGQKDVIGLTRASTRLLVSFRYYSIQSFDYDSVKSILVHTLGGNDIVRFSNDILQPLRIYAGIGDDFIEGGGGKDKIFGDAGDDTLLGQGGNDLLRGEGGNDRLTGGAGNDRLYGGDGRDGLRGEAGRDTMTGEAGNDSLFAKDGERDLLDGGPGKDRGEWDKEDARKLVP